MKLIGNIIWFVFGGVLIFFEYLVASILLCITIIGIPFGVQTFKLAVVALWPFGKEIKYSDKSSGCLSILMNIIWFIVGGIWICLSHLLFGVVFFITIIGIPFAQQHFKLAGLALSPFGRKVVNYSDNEDKSNLINGD